MRETEGNVVSTHKRQSGHSVRRKMDRKLEAQSTKDRLCLISKSMVYVASLNGTCTEYYATDPV